MSDPYAQPLPPSYPGQPVYVTQPQGAYAQPQVYAQQPTQTVIIEQVRPIPHLLHLLLTILTGGCWYELSLAFPCFLLLSSSSLCGEGRILVLG
jgi:hypothetical protein